MHSGIGAKIAKPRHSLNQFEYFFGEDQGRYIIEIDEQNLNKVEELLEKSGIHYDKIGHTQREEFQIEKDFKEKIIDLDKLNNKWYNNY